MINAKRVEKDQVDPIFEITNDAQNLILITSLYRYADMLKKFGFNVQPTSKKSLLKLKELSLEKKKEIYEGYNQGYKWLSPLAEQASAGLNFSAGFERACAQAYLDPYELEADESFWKTIRSGDVIEIYGLDMKQLYRGMNFYNYSQYSLSDFAVHEWYVLWERPKRVIDQLVEAFNFVVGCKVDSHSLNISKHVLRETLNVSEEEYFKPRACLMEFATAGVLRNKSDGSVGGVICSSRGEIIAEGNEALTIDFV